jgi:DUF4097 and DUF4098 domain-containing protein YvlB
MRNLLSVSIAAAALMLVLGGSHAVAADTAVDRTVKADPGGTVVVENVAGDVQVQGWDRPEVNVTGRLQSGVERLDVTADGPRTNVRVVVPKGASRNVEAFLVIKVPATSALDVSTVSADIKVADISGAERLRSVSGDMRVPVTGAATEIKTVSGDLMLQGNGAPADLHVSTVSGDVVLAHSAGALDLTTVSGDVSAELRPLASIRARSTSGDLRLRGQLTRDARVDMETVSGDVHIDTPAEAGFATEIGTFSGDIHNCFGAKAEEPEHGPGARLNIVRGAGGAKVRVKTLSGDVALCDR